MGIVQEFLLEIFYDFLLEIQQKLILRIFLEFIVGSGILLRFLCGQGVLSAGRRYSMRLQWSFRRDHRGFRGFQGVSKFFSVSKGFRFTTCHWVLGKF